LPATLYTRSSSHLIELSTPGHLLQSFSSSAAVMAEIFLVENATSSQLAERGAGVLGGLLDIAPAL
jgi:hypothetical protein